MPKLWLYYTLVRILSSLLTNPLSNCWIDILSLQKLITKAPQVASNQLLLPLKNASLSRCNGSYLIPCAANSVVQKLRHSSRLKTTAMWCSGSQTQMIYPSKLVEIPTIFLRCLTFRFTIFVWRRCERNITMSSQESSDYQIWDVWWCLIYESVRHRPYFAHTYHYSIPYHTIHIY